MDAEGEGSMDKPELEAEKADYHSMTSSVEMVSGHDANAPFDEPQKKRVMPEMEDAQEWDWEPEREANVADEDIETGFVKDLVRDNKRQSAKLPPSEMERIMRNYDDVRRKLSAEENRIVDAYFRRIKDL